MQIARVFEPFRLASHCAARVSAVSPGLRYHNRENVGRNDGIAITEFAAVIHFDRDARQLFDHEFARQRRVPARAAGDDFDLAERLELHGRDVHFIEENAAGLLTHAAREWCLEWRAAARKFP